MNRTRNRLPKLPQMRGFEFGWLLALAIGLGVQFQGTALVADAGTSGSDGIFEHYFSGNDAEVARLLTEMNASERFELGMAAYSERELRLAEYSFLATLDANPGNHRARLELGRVFLEQRRLNEAELAFSRVLEERVPTRVAENIQRSLDHIEALRQRPYQQEPSLAVVNQQAKRQRFVLKTQISAGVTYDTNVNFGPQDQSIRVRPFSVGGATFDTLEATGESRPRESWGGYGFVSVGADHQLNDAQTRQAIYGIDYYRNWLQDASDLELSNLNLAAGLRLIGVRSFVELPIKYGIVELDGDGFLKQAIFNPGYFYQVNKGLISATMLQLRHKDFETANQLDGRVSNWNRNSGRSLARKSTRSRLRSGCSTMIPMQILLSIMAGRCDPLGNSKFPTVG